MTTNVPIRRAPLALAIMLALVLVSIVPTPAEALHQNCGNTYPSDSSRSNGHPNLPDAGLEGWAGQSRVNKLEEQGFALESTKDALLDGVEVAKSAADLIAATAKDGIPASPDPAEPLTKFTFDAAEGAARVVVAIQYVAAVTLFIAETGVKSAHIHVGGQVANENACNDVLGGDMLDHVWVSIVERNLASDGPPLATLLLPVDSKEAGDDSGEWPLQPQHEKEDFGWCPKIDIDIPSTPTDVANQEVSDTGGDCIPGVHDGFLGTPDDSAPHMSVEAIVRDTIDHAKAHGLPVREAETQFQSALTELDNGRWRDAYEHFRLAYQDAARFDG